MLVSNPSLCAWWTVSPNKLPVSGPSKENGWLVLTRPELTDGFQGIVFIDKIGREVCRVRDLPLISWCGGNRIVFGNLNHQPSGSSQSGVRLLVLSLKLPSSLLKRALVPIEELRDLCQSVLCTPSGDTYFARSLPHPCTAVSDLFLHFLHSSNLWLFESALLNSRQV